jgi:RNA polymerase sigma-70 factor, ECF subfamily
MDVMLLPPAINNDEPLTEQESWRAKESQSQSNGHSLGRFVKSADLPPFKRNGHIRRHWFQWSTKGSSSIACEDAQDMARLCAGNDDAMRGLMRRHGSRLHASITRMLKDREEAADVVEVAFIKVYQHRQHFNFESKFTTWLYTIALNLARNRLRSRARRPEFVSLESLSEEELESQQQALGREPSPETRLESKEVTCGLEDSLAHLPPKLRGPLELFAFEDRSQAEIAQRFGCTAKAIECRLFNARKRLRAEAERILHPRHEGRVPFHALGNHVHGH